MSLCQNNCNYEAVSTALRQSIGEQVRQVANFGVIAEDEHGESELEEPTGNDTGCDHALLYFTLVQDGALRTGFRVEFESLAWAAEGAAERTRRKRAHLGNLEAAVYLHELADARAVRGGDNPSAKEIQSTVLGVCDSRTNSTARRGRGRTGKVDSGIRRHAEGDAYLHGTALVHQHEAPRRRSYRFRVSVFRDFLSWLALNHQQVHPLSWLQLTEYLLVKLEEPRRRAGLKHTPRLHIPGRDGWCAFRAALHKLLVFPRVPPGVARLSPPWFPLKQAPRFLVAVLAALKPLVVDNDTPQYLKMFVWWLLL